MPVGSRIAIFEDNDSLRESLVYLLKNSEDYEVVSDQHHCTDAASLVRVYLPDIVLMDIDMPGPSGIEGVKAIKEARPETLVLMYTVFEDNEKLFQCLCAGADGYLLKKTPPALLFAALQDLKNGGAPMSPQIARRVLSSFQKGRKNKYELSAREVEVLELLIKGYSTKMIAAELAISFDTARFHLKNIYRKLHVNCGKEAIAKALSEHIL